MLEGKHVSYRVWERNGIISREEGGGLLVCGGAALTIYQRVGSFLRDDMATSWVGICGARRSVVPRNSFYNICCLSQTSEHKFSSNEL